MAKRGQSELLSAVIYIGFALLIGVSMLSYIASVVSGYRDSILLSNHLANEASSILINIISFDDRSSTLWILLKRVDGSQSNFFIAVDNGTDYISCNSIYVYNLYSDNDGILCNSPTDCIVSTPIYVGPMDRVYIPWEGTISSFLQYARVMGYSISDRVYICSIENICRRSLAPGLCSESSIVKIQLPPEASKARIFMATLYSGRPYIVGIYEVSLR